MLSWSSPSCLKVGTGFGRIMLLLVANRSHWCLGPDLVLDIVIEIIANVGTGLKIAGAGVIGVPAGASPASRSGTGPCASTPCRNGPASRPNHWIDVVSANPSFSNSPDVIGSQQHWSIGATISLRTGIRRMDGFQAIVLVCLAATPVDQCDENSAVDVMSTHVDNEMRCSMGWQDIIARGALATDQLGKAYVRTLCRRVHKAE